MCLALGVVAALDVAFGDVKVSAYFAAALAVVGVGLLIGAWLGRARWLILLGVLLAGALGIASGAEADRFDAYRPDPDVIWHPTSLAELDAAYSQGFGDATLDLRDVDFTAATTPVHIDVSANVGDLRVLLPENVDADVTARINAGDATVLDEHWGGVNNPPRRVQDTGADGPGGGRLVLDARVNGPGDLEVSR